MGRLTQHELENLYRLQNNKETLSLFNELVRCHIDDYAKYLSKKIVGKLKDFKKSIIERDPKLPSKSDVLCIFLNKEVYLKLKITVYQNDWNKICYININTDSNTFARNFYKNFFSYFRNTYFNHSNDVVQTLQNHSEKLYKSVHKFLKTLLLLTINGKLN